jgi:hypothetical protein
MRAERKGRRNHRNCDMELQKTPKAVPDEPSSVPQHQNWPPPTATKCLVQPQHC